MPAEKIFKFIRLELNDKKINKWNGLDIARIQTAFSVSYDMTLIRLNALGIIDDRMLEKLKLEKAEKTATKLLNAIQGNLDLCKAAEVKKIPAIYLECHFEFYDKLIPRKSLERALNYVDLKVDDFIDQDENQEDEETGI